MIHQNVTNSVPVSSQPNGPSAGHFRLLEGRSAGNESSQEQCGLIVFGEVLYDVFEDGREILGGAPFNVAWALTGFGMFPMFVSTVGKDRKGQAICAAMEGWGMSLEGLHRDDQLPTGRVMVRVSDGEPGYEICAPAAWDRIPAGRFKAGTLLYHGALALRSVQNQNALRELLDGQAGSRFFDVNLRPPHTPWSIVEPWLEQADWVKLNLGELAELSGLEVVGLKDAQPALENLRARYGIGAILLTAGAEGARMFGGGIDEMVSPAPKPVRFVDAVGAGDAFTAATIQGLLAGLPPRTILRRAAGFAARVCGLRGATTADKAFYRLDEV